ncbi:hypothetical protein [Cobetia amphilecti]|uniref:hypothetical protein n=1 Tax=Cobetia amphilecti TaxID=1055104 RepID=UPI002448623C|nr:hypothetical protein [Cobetia litoralis]MDH2423740.1 hypothetical protein [Cobetia litoralis]
MLMKSLFIITILSIAPPVLAEDLEIKDYFELLEKNGYTIGRTQEKYYQFLMAVDGYGVDVDGSMIEVYQFDLTIKTGQLALEKLEDNGFMGSGFVINNNLALAKKKKHPKWNDLKRIFLSM